MFDPDTNDITITAENIGLMAEGLRIGNSYIISDIEVNGCAVKLEGLRWWDIRPMVDPREHAPQVIDQAEQALRYALGVGLVAQHPTLPHLVRITQQQAPKAEAESTSFLGQLFHVRFPPTPAAPAQGESGYSAWDR